MFTSGEGRCLNPRVIRSGPPAIPDGRMRGQARGGAAGGRSLKDPPAVCAASYPVVVSASRSSGRGPRVVRDGSGRVMARALPFARRAGLTYACNGAVGYLKSRLMLESMLP